MVIRYDPRWAPASIGPTCGSSFAWPSPDEKGLSVDERDRAASRRGHAARPGFARAMRIAAYYRIGADPVQLARELALGAREANEGDLIRAAKLLGMRARLV